MGKQKLLGEWRDGSSELGQLGSVLFVRLDSLREEMEASVERMVRGCHHQKTGRDVRLDGVRGQWVNDSHMHQKSHSSGLTQMGLLKEERK